MCNWNFDKYTESRNYLVFKWVIWKTNLKIVVISLIRYFPTFFASWHPYKVKKVFGGTPRWLNRSKDQGIARIVIIGGTPAINSLNPSVSRDPGWESLV